MMLSRRLLIAAAVTTPAMATASQSVDWQETDLKMTLEELIERARSKVGEGELELTISVGQ
jgi:hypothetical protein